MSDDKDVTFNLKAVINKQKSKVLFAEVDNEFADALLSFMTLPLGRIVQILEKHYGENTPVIGSLNTLYNGVENLDHSHFKSYDDKLMLLNPASAYASPFKNMHLSFHDSESTDHRFGKALTGKFIENKYSFIVSDDLQIVPVKNFFLHTIHHVYIDIAHLDGAETRNVTFGVNEFMDLLKGSLVSRHPLTDIILGTSWMNSAAVKFEPLISYNPIMDGNIIVNFQETELVATFEKSTKKFLFAQADEDFVDFLFSLLLIPLGKYEMLFRSNSGLNNIGNLHSSILRYFDEDLLNDTDCTEDWLLGYLTLTEEKSWLSSYNNCKPIFLNGISRHVFIVSDDLTVTPLSVCSTLSLLNQMKVSPSDVEEVPFEIGFRGTKHSESISYIDACIDRWPHLSIKSMEMLNVVWTNSPLT